MNRGDAAAATWIFLRRIAAPPRLRRGYSFDESPRRRSCDVDNPWRPATPRPRRGPTKETGRTPQVHHRPRRRSHVRRRRARSAAAGPSGGRAPASHEVEQEDRGRRGFTGKRSPAGAAAQRRRRRGARRGAARRRPQGGRAVENGRRRLDRRFTGGTPAEQDSLPCPSRRQSSNAANAVENGARLERGRRRCSRGSCS